MFTPRQSTSLSDNLNDEASIVEPSKPASSQLCLAPPSQGSHNSNSSNDLNECDSAKLKLSSSSASLLKSSDPALNSAAFKRHWGEEIEVELIRAENKGFGISIIGGKDNSSQLKSSLTGILIKKILPDSPALRCALLKTGDRLLEVGGVDLRNASHDEAVEVIKNAISPVKFVVQSLLPLVQISFFFLLRVFPLSFTDNLFPPFSLSSSLIESSCA